MNCNMEFKYVAWEFLNSTHGNFAGCYSNIDILDNQANGLYPNRYKNEPAYPYIMVFKEKGKQIPIIYCYLAQ